MLLHKDFGTHTEQVVVLSCSLKSSVLEKRTDSSTVLTEELVLCIHVPSVIMLQFGVGVR